jgi:hypothetical protein
MELGAAGRRFRPIFHATRPATRPKGRAAGRGGASRRCLLSQGDQPDYRSGASALGRWLAHTVSPMLDVGSAGLAAGMADASEVEEDRPPSLRSTRDYFVRTSVGLVQTDE